MMSCDHEPHTYGPGFHCDGVATLAPDPYAEEIEGDSTSKWMTECDRYESAMDI